MSGLVDKSESKRLKEKMFDAILDHTMFVDDVFAVYDLIEGEEFSSSF